MDPVHDPFADQKAGKGTTVCPGRKSRDSDSTASWHPYLWKCTDPEYAGDLCIPFWYLRNGISDRVLCVYSGKSDKGTGEILAAPAPCSICGRDPLHLCILWEKLCGGALRKQSSGSTVWMADVPCSDRRHETLCRQRKQWVAAPEAEKLWTLCVPLSAVICLRICTVYLYESSGYPAVCSDRAGSFLWWSAFV